MQQSKFNQSITIEDVFTLFTTKQQDFKSMELYALLEAYIKMQEPLVRPDTLNSYRDHLEDMIQFFNACGAYESKHINQSVIDRYVRFSINAGNKNITINKRMGMFTAMLKRTAKVGLITMPQYKYEKLKEAKAKIEIIEKEDIIKILNQINTMKLSHQIIIYLLLSTGIRRNEVVNIKMQNINFKNKSIYLEHTKSGKPRYCYFGEKLEVLIKKQIEQNNPANPYLLQTYRKAHPDKHIDKGTVSSMLNKLKNDLGIDVLSAHKFRHLYATQLLKNGADIFTVKELLGHEDLKITQRYLDFTNEELKQNNFKYNPLRNFE